MDLLRCRPPVSFTLGAWPSMVLAENMRVVLCLIPCYWNKHATTSMFVYRESFGGTSSIQYQPWSLFIHGGTYEPSKLIAIIIHRKTTWGYTIFGQTHLFQQNLPIKCWGDDGMVMFISGSYGFHHQNDCEELAANHQSHGPTNIVLLDATGGNQLWSLDITGTSTWGGRSSELGAWIWSQN